jgi:hypothetical protein
MAEFPYTPNPVVLKKFFAHIQSAGVPEKVTIKYLAQVGFKSTNDRYVISLLKFLGLLDSSGVPSKVWQRYRNRSTSARTLAGAIRNGYSDLFRTFPDAYRKDNEALRNYFSAHSKVAERTLGLIVSTFKSLCDLADFEEVESSEPTEEAETPEVPPTLTEKAPPAQRPASSQIPAVNINIQLQLPATDDAGIYDKLFAALKKHLLS